jgi:sugar diacid utilization regulator
MPGGRPHAPRRPCAGNSSTTCCPARRGWLSWSSGPPRFGLRLEAQHAVLVAAGSRRFLDHRVMVRDVEAALLERAGASASDANLLVATRAGLLVAVVPPGLRHAAEVTAASLDREPGLTWRLAISRTRSGAGGVRTGYDEARDALELADRLGLPDRVVRAEDLLIYQVLTRDREMAVELVETVLKPLEAARGGAEPLLETLRVYFACDNTAVHAAKRLHLSVRAVTYRLDRVRTLTGRDAGDPGDRFVLDAAVRSAAVLGWPAGPLRS